jgi:hypothetical protein
LEYAPGFRTDISGQISKSFRLNTGYRLHNTLRFTLCKKLKFKPFQYWHLYHLSVMTVEQCHQEGVIRPPLLPPILLRERHGGAQCRPSKFYVKPPKNSEHEKPSPTIKFVTILRSQLELAMQTSRGIYNKLKRTLQKALLHKVRLRTEIN